MNGSVTAGVMARCANVGVRVVVGVAVAVGGALLLPPGWVGGALLPEDRAELP